ncbi:MAG TPA: nucleoid-associated protein, partial [Ktedonobacterales bacterium]
MAEEEVHIERLILHHLDHRTHTLQLVEEPATLDDHAAAFFAAHITAAMARADWRARFAEPAGEVATLCRQLLTPATFVAASQALAQRLYAQMRPRQIAPGDFVAIVYTQAGETRPQIALLKLDPDRRLARSFSHAGGHLRVSIRATNNLLPLANALQKCALLHEEAPGALAVTLLDTQAGPRSDGVAAFFYRGFLTVALAPSARRRTRLFLSATEAWLDAHHTALTPAELFGFYRARRAALARARIALAAFAQAALPTQPELRAPLRAALGAALFPSPEPSAPSFAVDRAVADPV